MKKIIYTLTFIFCLISLQLSAQDRRPPRPSPDFDKAMNKYATAMYFINSLYVDTINMSDFMDKNITNALSRLDPHSSYISKEDFTAMNEPLQGNFDGIGIEFNVLHDTLLVITPIIGGPSERVGIRAGDRIIKVDTTIIAGVKKPDTDIIKLLRGPKGTKVKLTILRKEISEELIFEVTRDKIPINSVDASYEVKPGIAYIKLSRFADSSLVEVKEAFNKFKKKPDALILDLRSNGGGVLNTAFTLTNQFFDADKLLFYTEGSKSPKSMMLSNGNGFFKEGKLIVLLDEGSASASEILAGAIQDWDRGILIGRRSFGKGLVQQQLPLSDGSFMRLTISRYHTPTGRVIQRPYDMGETEKYYTDLYKRFSNGEVYSKDSIKFPDSLQYTTLKNNRIVYGGGGIMPDIFIPVDTSRYSKYYGQLNQKGIIHQFVLNYVDNNRSQFKKQYKNFTSFDEKFSINDNLINELVAYGEKQGLPKDEEGLTHSKADIKLQLKALVARDIFTTTEYYRVIHKERDETFMKAIDVIDKWNEYEKTILH